MYYLVGGITVQDYIGEIESIWMRPNLVAPPSLIQYTCELEEEIHFYVNAMRSCIFVMEYGAFSNDEMLEDYNQTSESIYCSKYEKLIDVINKKYNLNIKDVDWIMTLCNGERKTDTSHMIIDEPIFEENVSYVAFLDSAMIYQSIQSIAAFFRTITTKKKLSRYEQYKISFYMQEMKLIQSPSLYLTNSQEEIYVEEIYQVWKIPEQINVVLDTANQAINIFSFLANYKKNNEMNYSGLFMSYISALLLYEGIGALLTFLWPGGEQYIGWLLKAIILGITIVCAMKLIRGIYSEYKDKKDFRNNTGTKGLH